MKKINEAAFLRPWAMKEDVVLAMKEIVVRHLSGEKLSQPVIAEKIAGKNTPPPYEVVNGTARIPIYGVISKRMSMLSQLSNPGTSVLDIEDDLLTAVSDPAVERIVLDIDSPGGSSDGVIELSDLIYSLRGQKEIIAYANGQMCSAAYWLGSSADKVYASRGAMVGSIGVYAVIDDYTHRNWNEGIKTEVIKAGKNKAAGHPDKPFTEEDRKVIQEEVNKVYDLFVESVARNRGMSVDNVLKIATGDVFLGKDAVENGLVDGIKTFGALLNNTAAGTKSKISAGAETADLKIDDTTNQTKKEADMAKEVKTASIEDVKAENKAVADALIAEGRTAGVEEGKKIGAEEAKKTVEAENKTAAEAVKKAETERVSKIMEAMPAGMEALALSMIKEGKSPEEAKDAYLKAFKKEAPASPGASADPAPAAGSTLSVKEQAEKDFDSQVALQKEFGKKETYVAYKVKAAEGKVRILGNKSVK